MQKVVSTFLVLSLVLPAGKLYAEGAEVTIEGSVPLTEATAGPVSESLAYGGADSIGESSVTSTPATITVVGIGATILFVVGAQYFGKQKQELVALYKKAADEIEVIRGQGDMVDPMVGASPELKTVIQIEKKAIEEKTQGRVTLTDEQVLDAILKDTINLQKPAVNSK